MRFPILVCAAAALVATSAAASDKDDAMAPIKAFVAAIDKGDMTAAAATHVETPSIIDEFPPHHWSGAGAFAAWGADYGKDAQLHGDTDGTLTMHKVHRLTIEGDAAYAVVPTDFSYKRKGKAVVEHGTITYALARTPAGWRIASWTYSW
jgi:ketosteroid isomerase-like protein